MAILMQTNGGRNATTAHLLIPPSRSLARI
jgi:hypothetical protein